MPIAAAPKEPGKRRRSAPLAAPGKEGVGTGPGPAAGPSPGREHLPAAEPGAARTEPALRACGLPAWALLSSAASAGTPLVAPKAHGPLAIPSTGRGSGSPSLPGHCRLSLPLCFHLPKAPFWLRSPGSCSEVWGFARASLLSLPLPRDRCKHCLLHRGPRLAATWVLLPRVSEASEFGILQQAEGTAPKLTHPFLRVPFLLSSCTLQEIICVSSPDCVWKVEPLFFKRLVWQVLRLAWSRGRVWGERW